MSTYSTDDIGPNAFNTVTRKRASDTFVTDPCSFSSFTSRVLIMFKLGLNALQGFDL